MFLPAAEWLPDQPDYRNPGSSNIHNVYPKTESSYGPIASLNVTFMPLNARIQGAFSTSDSSGNVSTFSGTSTKLYDLGISSSSFTDVSGTAYSTEPDQRWQFCLFGSRVLATNFSNPVQTFTLGVSATFANLSATAPQARYMTVAKDFVILGNTYDATFGNQPQRLWWSAINDCTNWPVPGTLAAAQVQSDYQDIPGDQGWMMGLVGNLGTADIAIFFERAIWRGTYIGSPAIFSFSPAEGVRGTPSPGSIVQLGAVVFYLGEDGFYEFDGSSSMPIGAQKVDKTFYNDVNQSYMYRITSAIDPINKLVFWAYPSHNSISGNCDTLLIYNWALSRWATADCNCEMIFRAMTFGYTLDSLDSTGYSLDTLPFSLDSRVWTAGSILLAGFDTTHSLGYFTGTTLAATVETSEVEPAAQDPSLQWKRMLLTNSRPITDGGTPSVTIGVRDREQDAVVYNSPVTVNTYGTCPQRASGRYVRAQINQSAGDAFNHISGVEVIGIPEGIR